MLSMTSKKSAFAVFFFILFIMSGSAQAGNLFALDRNPAPVERQIGLFQQAIQWLGETWTGFKVTFEEDGTPPPPCTDPNACGPGANGEGGWTIDPDG